MVKPIFRSQLSPLERQQVRTLIAKDTIAIASIFMITVVLAVATYFLFQSYTTHRKDLADRWFARGQKALSLHQPAVAIDALHSALLYAPGQRQMEISLASALASAGRTAEATVYFNTLRETEPGNGEINLQLARLAVRSGNEELAKNYFHAAIYGNWEGDGYLKRRDTRLELVDYLIGRGRFEQARSELLVAAGNAPGSDLQVQSLIAGLLVRAHAPADALTLYQQLLVHAPGNLPALDGAAQTSYSLGDYQQAQQYLLKAVSITGAGEQGSAAKEPNSRRQAEQELLRKVNRLIVLNPSSELPPAMLAARLLGDREIASRRFQNCVASLSPPIPTGTGTAGAVSLTSSPAAGVGIPKMIAPLPAALADAGKDWAAEPERLTAADLTGNFQLEQAEIHLINETEIATAAVCGAPSGDDATLLRLAEVPSVMSLGQGHE